MEKIDWFNWCIMQSDPRDWKLWSSTISEIPNLLSQVRYEYNQLEYASQFGRYLCTLYAPIGMLSTEMQTIIESKDRRILCDLRTKMSDFSPRVWGYLVEGANCVRKWWNSQKPDASISQYAVNIHSDEFDELVAKWHRVNIGLRWNLSYNIDASDGILDNVNIGNTTYWHSTTIRKMTNNLHNWIFVIDSYFWEKTHNIYGFKNFLEFIKSGLVYETAYVFLKN